MSPKLSVAGGLCCEVSEANVKYIASFMIAGRRSQNWKSCHSL